MTDKQLQAKLNWLAALANEENLRLERDSAAQRGEWDDDGAESIRWGIVLGRAKDVPDPGQEGGCCDYLLRDVFPVVAAVQAGQPKGGQ